MKELGGSGGPERRRRDRDSIRPRRVPGGAAVVAPAAAAITVAGAVAAAGSPQTEGGGGPALLADRRAGVPALFAGPSGHCLLGREARQRAGLVPQLPPATAAERVGGPTGRVRGPQEPTARARLSRGSAPVSVARVSVRTSGRQHPCLARSALGPAGTAGTRAREASFGPCVHSWSGTFKGYGEDGVLWGPR